MPGKFARGDMGIFLFWETAGGKDSTVRGRSFDGGLFGSVFVPLAPALSVRSPRIAAARIILCFIKAPVFSTDLLRLLAELIACRLIPILGSLCE